MLRKERVHRRERGPGQERPAEAGQAFGPERVDALPLQQQFVRPGVQAHTKATVHRAGLAHQAETRVHLGRRAAGPGTRIVVGGPDAGVALGQVMAQQLNQGLQGAGAAGAAAAAAQAAGVRPDEVMATIEKLAELKAKGILTGEEFDAKKAELLKKLV